VISDDGSISGPHTVRCQLGYPPTPNSFTLQTTGLCSCLTPEQNTPNGVKSHNTSYKNAVPIFHPKLQFPFSGKHNVCRNVENAQHTTRLDKENRGYTDVVYQRRIF